MPNLRQVSIKTPNHSLLFLPMCRAWVGCGVVDFFGSLFFLWIVPCHYCVTVSMDVPTLPMSSLLMGRKTHVRSCKLYIV